jgi:anthranilate synthase component 2
VRLLFVENHDSFSWNVVDRLPFPREDVTIVSGRDPRAVSDALARCGALVIGPGPLDPVRAGLVELVQVAARRALPTLGICLGHQAIGVAFGAKLVRDAPCHGKVSLISFSASRFFKPFSREPAMRYHSLSLRDVAPPLRVTAVSDDGVVMAVEHEALPMAGLQFHPDSFGTPRGEAMIRAFFEAVA